MQTKASTIGLTRTRFVASVERLADMIGLILRQAGAMISDYYYQVLQE